MDNRLGWVVLSVLIVISFGVYTMGPALDQEELSVNTMGPASDQEEQPYGVTDLSKVEILTDESGYEYYIDESDGMGDRMYLDPIMSDGRTPEEIAQDLFFEGKRVEYERRLDRSISDMEFQVMYEQEYKEVEQRKANARGAASAYMQANPTGLQLAWRQSFCGDDAMCMQTGVQ